MQASSHVCTHFALRCVYFCLVSCCARRGWQLWLPQGPCHSGPSTVRLPCERISAPYSAPDFLGDRRGAGSCGSSSRMIVSAAGRQ